SLWLDPGARGPRSMVLGAAGAPDACRIGDDGQQYLGKLYRAGDRRASIAGSGGQPLHAGHAGWRCDREPPDRAVHKPVRRARGAADQRSSRHHGAAHGRASLACGAVTGRGPGCMPALGTQRPLGCPGDAARHNRCPARRIIRLNPGARCGTTGAFPLRKATMSFKSPDFGDRMGAAAKAKKAALDQFRAKSADPAAAERQAARNAAQRAREAREAERRTARREAEARAAAEQAALEAARAAEQAAREAALAEQAALELAQEAERRAAILSKAAAKA